MIDDPKTLEAVEARFVSAVSPTAPRIMAGGHPCQGLYWTPKGTPRPRTGLIATHYNVDFAEHYFAPYVASRGFGFLGWNTRYRGFEDLFLLEHALIDIGVGVRWLIEQAGVETVVIFGNSGGGSLMGAYQAEAIASTMAASLKGAGRDALASLPKAQLYISSNAHIGRPEVLTDWMDASVIDETDPVATDAALDPFNPDNGPPYSDAFITRYRAAQRARNQRITDWAKAELARLNASGVPDRLFPLFRCWGDLRAMDPAIDPSDRKPRWCYRGDPAIANRTPSIGRANMLQTWLSMWSLETSKCVGTPHLKKFDTPTLVVQGTADTGVFPTDARKSSMRSVRATRRSSFSPASTISRILRSTDIRLRMWCATGSRRGFEGRQPPSACSAAACRCPFERISSDVSAGLARLAGVRGSARSGRIAHGSSSDADGVCASGAPALREPGGCG